MNELISNTAFPNLATAIFSFFAMVLIVKWKKTPGHSAHGKAILTSLTFMCAGVMIHSVWWFSGHYFGGAFLPAENFFTHYKGLKGIVVAFCWGWGVVSMGSIFEQWHRFAKGSVFVGVFVLSYIAIL